jgi:hypothetical protein
VHGRGEGLEYRSLTFSSWAGSVSGGMRRTPVNVVCPGGKPGTALQIEDFSMHGDREEGAVEVRECFLGAGACLGEVKVMLLALSLLLISRSLGPSPSV